MIPAPFQVDPRAKAELDEHPYPLLFATVSGAHLYGFSSPDSDWDLRGIHILPARQLLGLSNPRETIEVSRLRDGLEIDLVTHDARKFFHLMLRPNGYVMEQLLSPLVIKTSPEHEELKALAPSCLVRRHAHHYLGFAQTQWRLFEKESPRRVKPLLYVYRVLLTGIHLMRTGKVEAALPALNEEYRLPYVEDLIARKRAGPEKAVLGDAAFEFHSAERERLVRRLEEEYARSSLPEAPKAKDALESMLLRLRGGRRAAARPVRRQA